MLTFMPLRQYEPGIIARLLVESYAPLLAEDPLRWGSERDRWEEFDREAFANLDTIGACTFISCLGDTTVGMVSFDPRRTADTGLMGHICVLPEFRRRGYGKAQVEEALRRMRERGIRKAIVSTGVHPFFEPAQRLYLACGFVEVRRRTHEWDGRYGIVEFERSLE